MSTLYVSDLDGTLLGPRARLSPFAVEHLRKLIKDGMHFSIATARTWESTQIVLEDILPLPVPVVLQNGALVYDSQREQYVKKEIIPPACVRTVLEQVRLHGQSGFLYGIKEGYIKVFHEDLTGRPFLQKFKDVRVHYYDKRFVPVNDLAACTQEDIVYFTTQGRREDLLPLYEAYSTLPGIAYVLYPDSYDAGNWYLECFSESATKYNAVKFLREAYGYGRVVGFGDNFNDIPLLQACDVGCAMGNARPELKDIAHHVIGTNEEDGVVRYLMEETS